MSTMFWMVWREGSSGSSQRHPSLHSARIEAERLARLNHGERFHVLQSVACCTKTDVIWEAAIDEQPPF